MFDFDSLPPDVRREHGSSLPRTVKRVERPRGKRYLCEYCGNWVLEKEVRNGNCPNCAAPIKEFQLADPTFMKCLRCGTVEVHQYCGVYHRGLDVEVYCKCGHIMRFESPITKKDDEYTIREKMRSMTEAWERDVRYRCREL